LPGFGGLTKSRQQGASCAFQPNSFPITAGELTIDLGDCFPIAKIGFSSRERVVVQFLPESQVISLANPKECAPLAKESDDLVWEPFWQLSPLSQEWNPLEHFLVPVALATQYTPEFFERVDSLFLRFDELRREEFSPLRCGRRFQHELGEKWIEFKASGG
jgi:hypothetical protein